ncbi:MAG: hypothetical protein IJA60_00975 [Clostridia bacterium]|nr:hypothetical protein [Clostridia bacterium]
MRKLLICIFCICLLVGAITVNAADSGPVALYTFDNGDLSDSSGNGYTGVAAGAKNLTFATAQERGGVLELNNHGLKRNTGASGFQIPTDGLKEAENFTLVMDMYVQTDGTNQNWFDISAGSNTASSPHHYLVGLLAYSTCGINSELKTTLVNGTSSVRIYKKYTFDKVYQWAQIAYVNEGGNATIYLDGEVVASGNQKRTVADMLSVDGATITVGMSSFWNDPGLDARIDNVAVYDRALDASELSELVTEESPALEAFFPELGENGLVNEYSLLNSTSLTKGDYLVTYTSDNIAYADNEALLVEYTGTEDYIFASWEGRIAAPEDGNYTFYLYSDNGVRLYIDGKCVIDWWVTQWDKEQQSASVYLEKGVPHTFKLEWLEYTGGSHVLLRWKNDKNIGKTIVPQSAFYLPADFDQPIAKSIDVSDAKLDRNDADFGGSIKLHGYNLENAEKFILIGASGVDMQNAPELSCTGITDTYAVLSVPEGLMAGKYRVKVFGDGKVSVSEDAIEIIAADGETSRPEHPDPAWKREDWINLNGYWDFTFDPNEVGIAEKWYNGEKAFDKKINVPYPWESELSGIADTEYKGQAWYSRTLSVPEEWLADGKAVYVCFGAVDAKCRVFVNGTEICSHDGGYTPFEVDVTSFVTSGDNNLTLWVEDKADFKDDTYIALVGKQGRTAPVGYTHTSGIWQTVYMECRSKTHLDYAHANVSVDLGENDADSVQFDLRILADKAQTLTVNYDFASYLWDEAAGKDIATGSSLTASHNVTVTAGENTVKMPVLSIENAKWWSPEEPNLYYGTITLSDESGNVLDRVSTYFGLREVYTEKYDGRAYEYIYFNGAPVFMSGVLDQGFYRDGIYTAPSEETLKFDVLEMKKLGFNTIRKHLKIEDPLQYYWCDKLGMFVWQDMPHSTGMNASAEGAETLGRKLYEASLLDAIDRDYNRPSIVLMVLFNETWGIKHDAPKASDGMTTNAWMQSVYYLTKEKAPHLLVEDMSACNEDHIQPTDIVTFHEYPNYYEQALELHLRHANNATAGSGFEFRDGFSYEGEPLLNSEYGGVGCFEGDLDVSLCFKYQTDLFRMHEIFNGYIYTEPYDVEYERNGIFSYDRRAKVFPYGEIAWGGDMTVADLNQSCFVGVYNQPAEEIAAGGRFSADMVAVNFSARKFENASLHWRFDATDAFGNSIATGLSGELEIPYSSYTAEHYSLEFDLPDESCVGTITVWVEENGIKIAKNFINVIVNGDIDETEYFSNSSVALRKSDTDASVYGSGSVNLEYALPEGYDMSSVTSMRIIAEVSSMKESTMNYNIYNSEMSQTVEGGERPSDMTVYVNGIELDTVYLPDNPRDMRAALTINDELNKGSSAGNFGYLVNIRVPDDKIDDVREAILADGKITVTYAVKEDADNRNGIRLYNSENGRYMLSPTVLLNPMDVYRSYESNYSASAMLSDGDTLSVRGGNVKASLRGGVLTVNGHTANLGEGAHTVEIRAFDTRYTVYADANPTPVIEFYDETEFLSNIAETTGEGLVIAPETYKWLLGDVDGDEELDIADVLLLLNAIVNEQDSNADMNSDGRITLIDVIALLKVVAA